MPEGDFYRLVADENWFETQLDLLGLTNWYDRLMYESLYNEPYWVGCIRQFRKVLAVIGWAVYMEAPCSGLT